MFKTSKLTRIAAVATVGLALAVPAAASAQSRRGDNAVLGGIVGALAGGLIGGDATGAIVGAGAGALLGAAATPDRRGYRGGYGYRTRYDQRSYGRGAYQPYRGGYNRYAGYNGGYGYGYGQPVNGYGYYGR